MLAWDICFEPANVFPPYKYKRFGEAFIFERLLALLLLWALRVSWLSLPIWAMFSAADSNVSAISSTLIFLGADCGGDGTKDSSFPVL